MKKYHISILLILMLSIVHSSCKKEAVSSPYERSEWKMDTTGKYPYTMTAVVTLPPQLNTQLRSEDKLGAFIDGTCRGIGSVQNVDGTPIFFVLIHGEVAEQQPVVFRYYSTSSSTLYYSSNTLMFLIDNNFGMIDDPEMLKFRRP